VAASSRSALDERVETASSEPRLDALHGLRSAKRRDARQTSVREVRRGTPAASVLLGRPTVDRFYQTSLN